MTLRNGLAAVAVAALIGIHATSVLAQDAPAFTREEVDILQTLAERRAEIERLESAVDQREAEIGGIEQRIDGKIAAVARLRCEIIDLVRLVREREEERQLQLVKMYESMKARDAARIFNGMDILLAGEIAVRMNARKLSDMMGRMNPAPARDLTRLLAQLRSEPAPRAPTGGGGGTDCGSV